MSESSHRTLRILSVVAGTITSLACGTNVMNLLSFYEDMTLTSCTVRLFSMGASIRCKDAAFGNAEQPHREFYLCTLEVHIDGKIRELLAMLECMPLVYLWA